MSEPTCQQCGGEGSVTHRVPGAGEAEVECGACDGYGRPAQPCEHCGTECHAPLCDDCEADERRASENVHEDNARTLARITSAVPFLRLKVMR